MKTNVSDSIRNTLLPVMILGALADGRIMSVSEIVTDIENRLVREIGKEKKVKMPSAIPPAILYGALNKLAFQRLIVTNVGRPTKYRIRADGLKALKESNESLPFLLVCLSAVVANIRY